MTLKCNYTDTFAQVRLWDIIIYNYLREKDIVLMTGLYPLIVFILDLTGEM